MTDQIADARPPTRAEQADRLRKQARGLRVEVATNPMEEESRERTLLFADADDAGAAALEEVATLRARVQHLTEALGVEEQIARLAHRGQVDKTGRPYIEHVERVVARVKGDPNAEAVAWLHDVLEDTPITSEVLGRFVDTVDVIEAVELLTRRPPYDYAPYIAAIAASGHPLAIAVKLADLRDHLETPGCPESLRSRYERALAALTPPASTEGSNG